MFDNKENKVGNVTGDYNQIIQIILSDGEKIQEKLGVLIDRLLNKEQEETNALKQLLKSKEEALSDKKKILDLQDVEVIRLKTELKQKEKELAESEQRFTEIFIENNGKDFTGSVEIYPKALKALTTGNKLEALKILDRLVLLEQKRKLDQEKEQQTASWLLRADLLKDENSWGGELNECYDIAININPTWGNYLEAANHFKFINNFEKALRYYHNCLQIVGSNYEKATTLNNLAVLQRAKNEFEKAEQSYQEALEIRRKLAEVNPQTYLPYVAGTLNNLAVLQSAKNEFEKAEQSYQEALEIRLHFAELIPQTYEIPLADTYLCLSNLYRYNIEKEELSKEYAKKAIELYKKYWDFVPYAKKWGNVAKSNLDS